MKERQKRATAKFLDTRALRDVPGNRRAGK